MIYNTFENVFYSLYSLLYKFFLSYSVSTLLSWQPFCKRCLLFVFCFVQVNFLKLSFTLLLVVIRIIYAIKRSLSSLLSLFSFYYALYLIAFVQCTFCALWLSSAASSRCMSCSNYFILITICVYICHCDW